MPCVDDRDCASGQRCNTIRDECQELYAAQLGEPCSIAEHCDEDLVCPGVTCEQNAYGPCDTSTNSGCGPDYACLPLTQPPADQAYCALLDCTTDADCPNDGFDDRAAPVCLPDILAEGGSVCAVPCSDDSDCGAQTSFYDALAYPSCGSYGACIWSLGS